MTPPLPFDRVGDVQAQGGAVTRANLACSQAWPASNNTGNTGQQHTHTAQADLAGTDELQATNAKLEIDDVVYSIVRAEPHEYLPHVDLELRRVRGG